MRLRSGRCTTVEVLAEPTVKPVVLAESTVKPVVLAEPTVEPDDLAESTVEPDDLAEPTVEPVVLAEPTVEPVVLAEPTVEPVVLAESTVEPVVLAEPTVEEVKPSIADFVARLKTCEQNHIRNFSGNIKYLNEWFSILLDHFDMLDGYDSAENLIMLAQTRITRWRNDQQNAIRIYILKHVITNSEKACAEIEKTNIVIEALEKKFITKQ